MTCQPNQRALRDCTINVNLRLASWNVDSDDRHERRAAIVARELTRYKIDIAALSETRLSGETELEKVGAGYVFLHEATCRPAQAGGDWLCHQDCTHISTRANTARFIAATNDNEIAPEAWKKCHTDKRLCSDNV